MILFANEVYLLLIERSYIYIIFQGCLYGLQFWRILYLNYSNIVGHMFGQRSLLSDELFRHVEGKDCG